MCGFVGYVSKKAKDNKVIHDMNDMIIHRGPNDEGYYIDENISLGFRRLSIIDLKGGKQPIANKDNSIILVYNGELYNFKDLRKKLENKYDFKTNSDTEVLLHAYEEYGVDVLKYLRGMFSFVIWNKKKNELFGARDYFGIKPFYYTKMGDTFMFASEIKSFLKHPDFKKEINAKAIKPYLTFQYSVLDETFFKDVYRLKPGHYFIYKDNKLEIKRYFDYNFEVSKRNFKDTVNMINQDVDESVKYHKVSDVKLGAFLSGGVDSSYIVSALNPEKTFSVGFDYEKFNETNYAKELSDLLNINNSRKLINADEFFDSLEMVQYYSDEPHANLSAVPLYFLSKLAKKDVTVVLSGEGADELYGGYDAYYQPKLFKLYQKLPFDFRKKVYDLVKEKPYFKGKSWLIKGGMKLEDYYIGQAFIFDDDAANSVLSKKYQSNFSFKDITKPIFDKVKDKDEITKMQYLDMNLWLPNDILLKADKMTMANSLELRVPFLDINVFNNSRTISSKYKIKGKLTKVALRKASEKKVPVEWAKRKKKGFPVPFSIWLREEKYYNYVKEIFLSKYAKEFFNQENILALLEDHYNNITNNGRKIYTILSFLIWYKKYFVEVK